MNQSTTDRRLLELAMERGLLSSEEMLSVTAENSSGGCDLAIRRNLLTVADVDLLRPLSSPGNFLPDYEFIELIGEGAMGAVYKAKQLKLDRIVALKLLKRRALENHVATSRSQIEARVGAKLRHPNIVSVYDYGVEDNQVYLALEFVGGESLLDVIRQRGPLDGRLALEILKRVVFALAYAARHGVVHRDIKPANLLVTDEVAGLEIPSGIPAVLVSDFGLTTQAQNEEQTRLTVDGTTVGTPCYAAPEQLKDSDVDSRADIYALGASLYHMIQGEPPYAGKNAFVAIAAKIHGHEKWRESIDDDVSPSVRQLILDMTHWDQKRRIQNYESLAERIDLALAVMAGTDESASGETTEVVPTSLHSGVTRARSSGVGTATVLSLAMFVPAALWWPGTAVPVEVPVIRGRQHALFNGFSTPKGLQAGQWNPTTDAETGGVEHLGFRSFCGLLRRRLQYCRLVLRARDPGNISCK